MSELLLPRYLIRRGSTLDRSLLVKFMQRTYQDIFPQLDFSHLTRTVEQYFSSETPLWWVDFLDKGNQEESSIGGVAKQSNLPLPSCASPISDNSPIACLWVGNAINQLRGDRHTHIFLLYVVPAHRRRGIGTALMQYVENWARTKGDRQIGLQVFESNTPALNLYNQLGYQTQSLWMVKSLHTDN